MWFTNWRKSAVGLKLMIVENKEYGCGDGIYFTETPVNLSSAKGQYGYVFSGWRDMATGWCSSTHLKWVQVMTANFKYGFTPDLFTLSNHAVFFGSGGVIGNQGC